MSQVQVNSLRHLSASSDAITLASDGTCSAKITNNLSNRRLNINGDMRIAQRSTSTATGDGVHTVDRMRSNRSGGTCQQQRATLSSSDTGPWEKGFKYSFKLTNTGSSGSEAAYREIQYRFEGQDINAWNHTSTSSYITVSFWAKSSVAGTYYLWLRSKGGTNKVYSHSYTLAANTWKKVSFTTPGASNVVINNDSVSDFIVNIAVDWGTDYTDAGTSTGSWATFASSTRLPPFAQDWTGTTNATFEVTGLQVEAGDVATEFEMRSYSYELARCQRYYQEVRCALTGVGASSSTIRACYTPPVNFRATPTITGSNPVTFVNPGVNAPTQSSFNCGLQFTYQPHMVGMVLGFGNYSNATQGYTYLQWDGNDDFIYFSAEL